MPRGLFVVFTDDTDQDELFEKALANEWDQFREEEGKDLICVTAGGITLEFQQSWDLAIAWDYDATGQGQKALERIASQLQQHMQDVASQGGRIGLLQHTGDNIDIQQEKLKEKLPLLPHCVRYKHQEGNPFYEAMASVLRAAGTSDAYPAALRRLFWLVWSPYNLTIDILRALCATNLEWPLLGQDAKKLRNYEVESRYERFKRLALDLGVTPAFTKADEYHSQTSAHLSEQPEAFHRPYEELRDALLAIVAAIEQEARGTPHDWGHFG